MPITFNSLALRENNPPDNYGGVAELTLYQVFDVLDWPLVSGPNFRGLLSVRNGATTATLRFTRFSASYREEEEATEHGMKYAQRIAFSIPRQAPDVAAWLHYADGRDWLALVTDYNRTRRLAGTPTTPLRLTRSASTGAQVSDYNGYEFSLAADTALPAYHYGVLERGKPFSNEFSAEFERITG